MPYLYLVLSVFGISANGIFGEIYNRKNEGRKEPTTLYNLLFVCATILLWGVYFAIDRTFDAKVLLYAVPMGVCYSLAAASNIYAIKYGSVVLTSLILQLSLIGVTIWGFIFWGDEASVLSVVGLVLAVAALVLCLYEKKDKKEVAVEEAGQKRVSAKWIILVAVMFFANAASTIIQRTQQTAYNKAYAPELMFFAMLEGGILYFLLFMKGDKSEAKLMAAKTGWLPALSGGANFCLNFCVILLATSDIKSSIVYPVISVGGLAVSSLASAFLFKERLHWWQWLGMAVGALAVVFLSV